jgi:hypothetical protein
MHRQADSSLADSRQPNAYPKQSDHDEQSVAHGYYPDAEDDAEEQNQCFVEKEDTQPSPEPQTHQATPCQSAQPEDYADSAQPDANNDDLNSDIDPALRERIQQYPEHIGNDLLRMREELLRLREATRTAEAKAEAEAKARAEAEQQAKNEARQRLKIEVEQQTILEAEARAKAEAEKKAKAEAERRKAETEAEARYRAQIEAKHEARVQAHLEAKKQAREEAKARAEARAKAEAEAEAERKKAETEAELRSMLGLDKTDQSEQSYSEQQGTSASQPKSADAQPPEPSPWPEQYSKPSPFVTGVRSETEAESSAQEDDNSSREPKKGERGYQEFLTEGGAINLKPLPPTPPDEYPLPMHPADIWKQACSEPRQVDQAQIHALAAQHEDDTGGFGMYWVGRAILAASMSGNPIRHMKMIKVILERWQREGRYGSSAPWERSQSDTVITVEAQSRPKQPKNTTSPQAQLQSSKKPSTKKSTKQSNGPSSDTTLSTSTSKTTDSPKSSSDGSCSTESSESSDSSNSSSGETKEADDSSDLIGSSGASPPPDAGLQEDISAPDTPDIVHQDDVEDAKSAENAEDIDTADAANNVEEPDVCSKQEDVSGISDNEPDKESEPDDQQDNDDQVNQDNQQDNDDQDDQNDQNDQNDQVNGELGESNEEADEEDEENEEIDEEFLKAVEMLYAEQTDGEAAESSDVPEGFQKPYIKSEQPKTDEDGRTYLEIVDGRGRTRRVYTAPRGPRISDRFQEIGTIVDTTDHTEFLRERVRSRMETSPEEGMEEQPEPQEQSALDEEQPEEEPPPPTKKYKPHWNEIRHLRNGHVLIGNGHVMMPRLERLKGELPDPPIYDSSRPLDEQGKDKEPKGQIGFYRVDENIDDNQGKKGKKKRQERRE